MRKVPKWFAAMLAAVASVLIVPFAAPVLGQVGGVSALATGTVVHADLLRSGDTKLVDAEVGFSGAAFDSGGLEGALLNEMDRPFAPNLPGKLAFGLGSPLEVGLGVAANTENQAILGGKSSTDAPPNLGLVTKAVGPIDLDPLVWVDLLRSQSMAAANDDGCALGIDAARGLAYITDVQLLDTASGTAVAARSAGPGPSAGSPAPSAPTGDGGAVGSATKQASGVLSTVEEAAEEKPALPGPSSKSAAASPKTVSTSSQADAAPNAVGLEQPLVALDAEDPARAVSQSRSRTVFVAQRARDGRLLGNAFGMMSEVRQTIAPVTLFEGTANELTIELLGEWVLQAVAGGLPGSAYIHYGPGDVSPETPVLRLIDANGAETLLSLQDIVGEDGLVIDIPGVAEIAIGEPPRAIDGAAGSNPTATADGTKVSAAVDVVRVRALPGAPAELADLRVGHMEVASEVPLGGASCSIPVKKTPSAESVEVDDPFTMTFGIDNPYDCTLTDVRLSDAITTEGDARFDVTSTDPDAQSPVGSALDAGQIRWSNIGDIAPHKTKTIVATMTARGGSGAILDKATATGTLSDCAAGGADVAGVDVGVVGTGLHGASAEVRVPVDGETKVAAAFSERGLLPSTGAPIAWLIGMSLALLGLGGAGLAVGRRVT